MLTRRSFLGAAVSVLTAIARARTSDADANLGAVLDRILQDRLRRSPEWTTTLGLDRDSRAGSSWQLDDRSVAAVESARDEVRHHLGLLAGIDPAALSSRSVTY